MADEDEDVEDRIINNAEQEAIRAIRRAARNREHLLAMQGRLNEVHGTVIPMIVLVNDLMVIRLKRRRMNDDKPMEGVPASWFFPRAQFYKHSDKSLSVIS